MAATSIKYELNGEVRKDLGRGGAREVRRQGKLPAVVYGKGLKENVHVAVDYHQFSQLYFHPGFYSHLVELKTGKETLRVVPRDVQTNPVTDRPEHVDFQFVAPGEKVRVKVSLKFTNLDRSPGIKKGGTLNIVRRELELWCDPDHIPQIIEIDMGNAQIAQSVHISHVSLPKGAAPTITDRDFTICTIVGRRGQKDDDDAKPAAEGAEAAAGDAAKAGDAKAAAKAPAKAAGK